MQIPQHAHCQICGKAIREGEKTCGKQCAAELDKLNNKRRRYMMIFYAATFVFMILLVLSGTGRL